MKIGDQCVHRLEAVSRGDEDRGIIRERMNHTILGARAFQGAQRGRSNRDNTPAPRPRRVQPQRRIRAHASIFGMHHMLVGICRTDGQKGTSPDMQSEIRPREPFRGQAVQQISGEMLSGCGRGNRPRFPRINRLKIRKVTAIRRA